MTVSQLWVNHHPAWLSQLLRRTEFTREEHPPTLAPLLLPPPTSHLSSDCSFLPIQLWCSLHNLQDHGHPEQFAILWFQY